MAAGVAYKQLSGARRSDARSCSTCSGDDPHGRIRPGRILLADKNYFGREVEASIADAGIQLLRDARQGEPERGAAVSSDRSAKPPSRSSTRSSCSSISNSMEDAPHK
jgi:hypothetical protein